MREENFKTLAGVCLIGGPLNIVFFFLKRKEPILIRYVALKKEASKDTVNKLEL